MSRTTDVDQAHAIIGGFVVRCFALDYRAGQLIARWFCTGEKQKFLSYVLHGMAPDDKRQVIEERLTTYHGAPDALRSTMAEVARVMERRRLVTSGLLGTLPDGGFCIKSFSGARMLSGADEEDIIPVDDLPGWSQQATRLSERLAKLGDDLRDKAG